MPATVGRTTVVILSGQTLFAEGVAARLRQHRDWLDLHVVDADHGDAFGQVVGANPRTLIVDSSDPAIMRHCSLSQLFRALPDVRLVRLDPESDQIQLLTSERLVAGDISDLISVIQPPDAMGEAD